MERHAPSGQFFNWYDHRTGAKLTVWPPSGDPIDADRSPRSTTPGSPSACGSSPTRVPQLVAPRGRALRLDGLRRLLPARRQPDPLPHRARHRRRALLLRHDRLREPDRVLRRDREGRPAEPRVLRPLAHVPRHAATARGRRRGRPASPAATRACSVYEGSYPYGDTRLVPSWGGSMFEALMPALFVPEESWGPGSWRANHPLTVDAQIDHGLNVAGYPAWGFSFSNNPAGGYSGYGVDAAGMHPNGDASNNDRHARRPRLPRLPGPPRGARPAAERVHERRRHAARDLARPALAARRRRSPRSRALEDLGAYTPLGFYDAVDVDTGEPSRAYLSLDQGMIDGGARQRARARRPARRVRHPRPRARGAPGGRGRGVQRPAARLHDHRDRGRRPAVGHLARRRDLRPRRRRRDPRLGRRRRRLRRRGRRRGARRRRRRHALRGRRRRRPARPARPRRARRRPGRRRAARRVPATTPSRAGRSPPLARRGSVPRR